MVRKVSVGLEADVAGFLGPVLETARATEKLKDEVEDLDHSLDKIPPDALKAGAAMKLLSGDVKDVGANFQAVGDKATAMTVLDTRIKNTRAEVKKLGDEFVKTGDIDVFAKLNKTSGDLSALMDFRKKLSNSVEGGLKDGVSKGGPNSAVTFASLIQGGLISAFMSLPTELKVAVGEAIVVAIVAASAPIGAAINGALLGGIGLGGIGIGIAGQIKNPIVQDAFTVLGRDLSTKLTSATTSFAAPLAASAGILDKALSGVLDKLEPRLAGLSNLVEPLARGIAGLATNAEPGFAKALAAAEPILREIAEQLPKLGSEVSRFFALIASGGEGAKDGIDLLFLALETLLVGIGGIIAGLSHLYEWFLAPGKKILEWYDDLTGKSDATGRSIEGSSDKATKSLEKIQTEAEKTATQVGQIDTAFSTLGKTAEAELTGKILNSMFALDNATLNFQDSLNKLDDSVKRNGTSLDIHKDKGLANARAILSAAQANAELYETNVAGGMKAEEAAQKYAEGTRQLKEQAAAAGYNSAEVQNLIGKYDNVPAKVQTLLATIGLTEALNHLSQILIDFRNLNGKEFETKYTVHTFNYTHYHSESGGGGKEGGNKYALGGIRKAAAGLILPPSDPGTVLAGEPQTGGEALIPFEGISQSRAWQLMQTVGDAHGLQVSRGGSSGPMSVSINFGGSVDGAFASAFMKLVRLGQIQLAVR